MFTVTLQRICTLGLVGDTLDVETAAVLIEEVLAGARDLPEALHLCGQSGDRDQRRPET